MKTFEKFLAESSKPIKQLGDNTGKIDTKRTPGNILDIEQKKFVQNEKGKKKVLRNLEPQNQVKKNVIPSSKPPVTRYDPREPFMDDDLGQRTGKTGDRVVNKPATQTSKVILGPDGKPLAYKGKNVPVVEPKAGETMIKGIKDTDLEQKALDQTRKDLLKPKTLDTKPVDTTNKTTNKVDKITKNYTKPKKGQEIKYNRTIDKKIKSIEKNKTKPRTIVKKFTTTPKSKKDFAGFMQRGLERTGVVDPKPQKEVKGKLKPLTKTDLKNTRLKTNIVKKTPKGLKAVRGLSTLGRIAGGAFAVQDFLSTAKREKAMGRGKTAARLAGLSKALGGYVGGGIGATLGAGVANLPGGIAGGAAGYHYGSKLGDKVYQTGRDLVTGKKTFKQLRKDIGKGLNTTKQGLNKRWNQYIDYKD